MVLKKGFEIRFEPSIGSTYYMYRRKSGDDFVSIISNEEWDYKKYNLRFLGYIKFLDDDNWEIFV